METTLVKVWRDKIVQEFQIKFPNFTLAKNRLKLEPRGLIKFQWLPTPELACYIAFRPINDEAFDAFVAWSTIGKFPISEKIDQPLNPQDFEAPFFIGWSSQVAGRSGLAHWNFWNPSQEAKKNHDVFVSEYVKFLTSPVTYEEAAAVVMPAIQSCIEELENFAMPLLRQRASYQRTA